MFSTNDGDLVKISGYLSTDSVGEDSIKIQEFKKVSTFQTLLVDAFKQYFLMDLFNKKR